MPDTDPHYYVYEILRPGEKQNLHEGPMPEERARRRIADLRREHPERMYRALVVTAE